MVFNTNNAGLRLILRALIHYRNSEYPGITNTEQEERDTKAMIEQLKTLLRPMGLRHKY